MEVDSGWQVLGWEHYVWMALISRTHLATREPMLLCTEQHHPKRPLADHCSQVKILKSSILALTEHRARSLWRQAVAAYARAAFFGAPRRKTFVAQARSVRVVRRASMGEWWDVDLFVARHRVGASGPPQSRSCSSSQHASAKNAPVRAQTSAARPLAVVDERVLALRSLASIGRGSAGPVLAQLGLGQRRTWVPFGGSRQPSVIERLW